jgi:DNA-binding MarR family transcriptional regulator
MNSFRRTDGGRDPTDSVEDLADRSDDGLDAVDREILQYVSTHDAVSPGVVAFELDYDIGTVYDRLGQLRHRGYIRRSEWSACSLSERGREYLTDVDA